MDVIAYLRRKKGVAALDNIAGVAAFKYHTTVE